ncbi:SHQ1 protein-domain-containing protein [Pilobolus umbonatus]|nr:SHQ1 protein-domain-containing protein [Pilobolus umbonatus]
MITPTFKVDQDTDSVKITINTPYVRAQDVDIYVEGSEFRFFLRPYFLRLHFPGNIVEDDDSKATYDPSAGQFNIVISKETKGENFEDLDLLTKLLARTGEEPKAKEVKKPMIEVIGQEDDDVMQDAIDYDWELPQELPKVADDLQLKSYYGFNNQYTGYFMHVQETMNEINDISNPDKSTAESRREERVMLENEKFDEDYYCGDYINDDDISSIIKYKTPYSKELKRQQKDSKPAETKLIAEVILTEMQVEDSTTSSSSTFLDFTHKEQEMMLHLPKKEFLLSNEKGIYVGLVDLLFAYSYNYRINEGDNNPESSWCIGKLSPTLSALDQFSTLKEAVIALMKLGKRAILKAFLDMKYLFDHHDVYYIYSKLYIDDYCVWIQRANDNVLKTLAHEIHHLTINKSEIGWELDELEEIADQMKEMQEYDQANERPQLLS